MKRINPLSLVQAILLSSFAVFALSFAHVGILKDPMSGMEGMAHQGTSAVQCQILCTTATKPDEVSVPKNNNDDNIPLPALVFVAAVPLALMAGIFIIKRVYLLSSWRPPDRLLLCGHYADGL